MIPSFAVSFLLLLMSLPQPACVQEGEVTVAGILQGVYDFEKVLVGVQLMTEDKNYFVADDLKGRELFAHVGRKVEVTGTWGKFDDEEDVIYVIHVTAYRLMVSVYR